MAVHALLLREGFSCIAVEEQNGKGPKGFAPPVRVVPENKLVPPRWNADPGACTFQYRHSAKPGKEFQVILLSSLILICIFLGFAFLRFLDIGDHMLVAVVVSTKLSKNVLFCALV